MPGGMARAEKWGEGCPGAPRTCSLPIQGTLPPKPVASGNTASYCHSTQQHLARRWQRGAGTLSCPPSSSHTGPPTQQPLQIASHGAPAEPRRLGRLGGLPPSIMRLLTGEPAAPAQHNRALSAGPAPAPAQPRAQRRAPLFPKWLGARPGASQSKPCPGPSR